MKKFLCLLLAAIMLLGCSLTVAEADEFPKLDGIAACGNREEHLYGPGGNRIAL